MEVGTDANSSHHDEIKDCSICLAEMNDISEAGLNNCMHTFHIDCISVWGKQSSLCPLCKGEFAFILFQGGQIPSVPENTIDSSDSEGVEDSNSSLYDTDFDENEDDEAYPCAVCGVDDDSMGRQVNCRFYCGAYAHVFCLGAAYEGPRWACGECSSQRERDIALRSLRAERRGGHNVSARRTNTPPIPTSFNTAPSHDIHSSRLDTATRGPSSPSSGMTSTAPASRKDDVSIHWAEREISLRMQQLAAARQMSGTYLTASRTSHLRPPAMAGNGGASIQHEANYMSRKANGMMPFSAAVVTGRTIRRTSASALANEIAREFQQEQVATSAPSRRSMHLPVASAVESAQEAQREPSESPPIKRLRRRMSHSNPNPPAPARSGSTSNGNGSGSNNTSFYIPNRGDSPSYSNLLQYLLHGTPSAPPSITPNSTLPPRLPHTYTSSGYGMSAAAPQSTPLAYRRVRPALAPAPVAPTSSRDEVVPPSGIATKVDTSTYGMEVGSTTQIDIDSNDHGDANVGLSSRISAFLDPLQDALRTNQPTYGPSCLAVPSQESAIDGTVLSHLLSAQVPKLFSLCTSHDTPFLVALLDNGILPILDRYICHFMTTPTVDYESCLAKMDMLLRVLNWLPIRAKHILRLCRQSRSNGADNESMNAARDMSCSIVTSGHSGHGNDSTHRTKAQFSHIITTLVRLARKSYSNETPFEKLHVVIGNVMQHIIRALHRFPHATRKLEDVVNRLKTNK